MCTDTPHPEARWINEGFRESWTRLIQKISENDPLLCLKCKGVVGLRNPSSTKGGSLTRFYTNQQKYYCRPDLHAKTASDCNLSIMKLILLSDSLSSLDMDQTPFDAFLDFVLMLE